MVTAFDSFYQNPNYIQYKRHLFNYQLRRRIIQKRLRGCGVPILDIGSGIAPMVSAGPGTILSDMSVPGMRLMKGEGYLCTVLDIQHLGLRTASFRTIVCSEVLEHVPDDRLALAELTRVLAPGGRLILTVPLHTYYWGKDDEVVGHFRRYDPAELIDRLNSLGLRVRCVKPVGSILERALTLGSVWLFLKLNSGGEWTRRPTAWFKAANHITAATLELAARFSPQSTCSIGLFDCEKTVLSSIE
ncbi:MAG TPA: class I SAM-dependent methyltransferase [Acidobacteriota bacterium]|jgi:SAM-dependent methyltransferase|nr:class I SAM-dependent methyltransferase [Acidobacteriota bacterium]